MFSCISTVFTKNRLQNSLQSKQYIFSAFSGRADLRSNSRDAGNEVIYQNELTEFLDDFTNLNKHVLLNVQRFDTSSHSPFKRKFLSLRRNQLKVHDYHDSIGFYYSSKIIPGLQSVRGIHTHAAFPCFASLKNVKKGDGSDKEQFESDYYDNLIDKILKDSPTKNKELHSEKEHRRRVHAHRFVKTETLHGKEDNLEIEGASLKEIERKYPDCKSKLHNIYNIVSQDTKKSNLISGTSKCTKRGHDVRWEFTYKILWPSEMTFLAVAKTKIAASKVAALKCLQWLEATGKVKNGIPQTLDKKEMSSLLDNKVELNIESDIATEIQSLLKEYQNEVEHIVKTFTPIKRESNLLEDSENDGQTSLLNTEHFDPVGGSSASKRFKKSSEFRNEILKEKALLRNETADQGLPISAFRTQILEEIEKSSVLLVKGDTGCGKTTQVPQFLMDYFAAKGRAGDCNMIVTQPRRISAISLAERIAEERNENIGDVVGYQVRLQQVLPQTPGGILFCTTGVLLRKLQSNPGLIGCSHVILDEAHERSIDTDVLMVLLKRAMKRNPNLKLIVMSATINAELFQRYFDCNAVEVPGRTFPVTMNFLEDIDAMGIRQSNNRDERNQSQRSPVVDCYYVARLIKWICKNKPDGAILCFLPGWAEITKVQTILTESSWANRRKDWILPLHSKVSFQAQRKIFSRPPPGVRKIILSTDIAETGITVSDVVYVIDTASHKQVRWDESQGLASMDNQWVSKANINQRKGRAGRVQSGISYHLLTREKFMNLDEFPLPEVMRISLEKTVLDCKTYSNEKAIDFLAKMPQPPSASAIERAVSDLRKLGALDENETLTALGKRISLFTTHPKLSKAMVYSSIFHCTSPIVSVASILSYDSELFVGALNNKSDIRSIKQKYHPASDHLAMSWLFTQWNSYYNEDPQDIKSFCYNMRLQPERMIILKKLRDLNAQFLVQCGMLEIGENYDDWNATKNDHAEHDELVRGVLFAGMDHLLQRKKFELIKGRLKNSPNLMVTEDKRRASLTSETVNYGRKSWPSPYLTYMRRTHSEERRTILIRETSILSPLTVFLFSQGTVNAVETNKSGSNDDDKVLVTIEDKKNVKLICTREDAELLFRFRDMMWSIVRYMVEIQGFQGFDRVEEYNTVNAYKRQMLFVLGKMLSSADITVDLKSDESDVASVDELLDSESGSETDESR
ncbi:putative ATP-dependent RNA helicase DHX30 isoform X2 [Cephus cinctus]|uniref:RNA helicase n=1 Tax=Cephus cinctus TaxID=211228 RepID=A0AAJ7CDY9_CEPCN|nr:putative ATP-dependent RNA helicase DHX30 isoform X2 [Cephus cinctus]